MQDIENIAELVYCCLILYDVAIEECILSSKEIPESADYYECVDDEGAPDGEPAGALAALAFIQQENEALTDHQLKLNHVA